jgi:glycyl-tRNA synthetase beta chain
MASFLLEVGTEELPATFVDSAQEQWRSLVPASLQEQFLDYGQIQFFATPRRLAVLIQGLGERQPDRQEEIKGPSAQVAFKEGKPTKAAEGFARSRNLSVADFEIRPTDKGEFVFVQQILPGRSTAEILTELVPQWISGLSGKRFMCWADGDMRFSRPIRWLVALLDAEVLPISLVNGSSNIPSDRLSQGHRVLHPAPVRLNHADEYATTLAAAYVCVDSAQRETEIIRQVQQIGQQVGGRAPTLPDLSAEVKNLVEWPTAVIGNFEPEFLTLPAEVITTVMTTHQRYFPVYTTPNQRSEKLALLPYFITISNGDSAQSALIAQGNERVIRARLTDGKFFYNADQAIPLAEYVPRLEHVTFQKDLGSVAAKVVRMGMNAALIAQQLQLERDQQTSLSRAVSLCKADLVTQMVGEFPELQGVMGRAYALSSGESAEVAQAIEEHYWPKGAGDGFSESLIAQVVGLADRLDTLVSIFSLGMLPTGSSDPFALRRAANAIVNIIWNAKLKLNLEQLLNQILVAFTALFPQAPAVEVLQSQLQEFFLQRLRSLLQEEGAIDYDLVNAVLGEQDPEYTQRALQDLLDVRERAYFLQRLRQEGTLELIYETVNRATRLARQGDLETSVLDPTPVIDPQLFQQTSEKLFYQALLDLLPHTKAALQQRNYQQLVTGLEAIAPTIRRFFDGEDSVMVMAEDPKLQRNRLNLLSLLRNHARVLADFGAIVKV